MKSAPDNLVQLRDFEMAGPGRHENLRLWLRLLTCTKEKVRGATFDAASRAARQVVKSLIPVEPVARTRGRPAR